MIKPGLDQASFFLPLPDDSDSSFPAFQQPAPLHANSIHPGGEPTSPAKLQHRF